MDDACSCAASSASAICPRNRQGLLHRDRTAREPLRQILALHQLHDECGVPAALFEPVDSSDVRMVQRDEGPYTVTAKIGEGGMGAVYRARDTKLDRDVAAFR